MTAKEIIEKQYMEDRPWVLDDDMPNDFENWILSHDLETEEYLEKFYLGL